ncbi:beta-amyrin 28-oxidase-like [Durio zibethinus]|uniref:Beta-amyrin 28-oxidase-like n=1 Tax=Durio zibethinus TaxID=66656 RepID=A0A6P5WXE5_DURZI|nr:beta-amyrin 28-oxidase-like [Durio zibethinus]
MDVIDSLMPYLVHLVVLYVSVGVIYLVYKYKSTATAATTNLPPGKKGLPYIGETLDYVLASRWGTPEKFVTDRTAKYSPDVFRTSLLGEDMVIFCGAAGNKFLFSGQNKYVTSWWPDSIKKALMDPSTVDNSSKEESTKLRAYLPPFLKPESLQHYIPVMDTMAKEHLDQLWSPYNQVQVFPLSKKYTFALACRLFMSVQDPDEIEKFAKPFALATAGLISVPIDLPGTTFNRAVKAGRQIRQRLFALITNKKNEILEKGKTVASDLVDSMLMDGMTEVEISNKIIGFFIASHDTTSTAITFIVSYLSDYPDIYNRVLEEQMEVLRSKGPGEPLKWEDIQKMKYTWCVACEVIRLAPPANGAFREAITDFTYAGYTIPKGWKAYWTVHTTNKNPNYFPNPEKFDPSRFEGNGPAPYTFVPFGGGPRMCPGKEYARLEILTFIHNFLTKFKWEKLNPNEKISYIPSPIPEEGLPIKLQAAPSSQLMMQ